ADPAVDLLLSRGRGDLPARPAAVPAPPRLLGRSAQVHHRPAVRGRARGFLRQPLLVGGPLPSQSRRLLGVDRPVQHRDQRLLPGALPGARPPRDDRAAGGPDPALHDPLLARGRSRAPLAARARLLTNAWPPRPAFGSPLPLCGHSAERFVRASKPAPPASPARTAATATRRIAAARAARCI